MLFELFIKFGEIFGFFVVLLIILLLYPLFYLIYALIKKDNKMLYGDSYKSMDEKNKNEE